MEPTQPLLTKKLCKMIRIVLFTVQKGVSMVDLNLIMKRGKVLKKAMNNLMLEHQASLSCRSETMDMSFVSPMICRSHDVHLSFVSPREYEFSCSSNCSNYRPYNPRFNTNRRSRNTRHYLRKQHKVSYHTTTPYIWVDDAASGTCSVGGESLGIGWSPLVRQVRITDSPFAAMRDGGDELEESMKVNKEAEKFIEGFYRELRLQKWMATHEASESCSWRA